MIPHSDRHSRPHPHIHLLTVQAGDPAFDLLRYLGLPWTLLYCDPTAPHTRYVTVYLRVTGAPLPHTPHVTPRLHSTPFTVLIYLPPVVDGTLIPVDYDLFDLLQFDGVGGTTSLPLPLFVLIGPHTLFYGVLVPLPCCPHTHTTTHHTMTLICGHCCIYDLTLLHLPDSRYRSTGYLFGCRILVDLQLRLRSAVACVRSGLFTDVGLRLRLRYRVTTFLRWRYRCSAFIAGLISRIHHTALPTTATRSHTAHRTFPDPTTLRHTCTQIHHSTVSPHVYAHALHVYHTYTRSATHTTAPVWWSDLHVYTVLHRTCLGRLPTTPGVIHCIWCYVYPDLLDTFSPHAV